MTKKIETTNAELQCATTVPEVVHLNIGMKGVLHTYKLVTPKRKRAVKAVQTIPTLDPAIAPSPRTDAGKGILGKLTTKIFKK